MKYFLLGSFASAILLFGSALLYGATGATSFEGIAASLEGGNADLRLTILGMALILIGLAFKVSAVPFHQWTPDAYEGASRRRRASWPCGEVGGVRGRHPRVRAALPVPKSSPPPARAGSRRSRASRH